MKLNWDTEIPSDLIKKWNDLLKILDDLDSIEINRNVFVNYENDSIVKRELHGFSDVSFRAYGAKIYVKTILECFHSKFEWTNLNIRISRFEILRYFVKCVFC